MTKEVDEKAIKKSLIKWNKILLEVNVKLNEINEDFKEVYHDILDR